MSSISANGATQTLYITEEAGTIYYKVDSGSLTSFTWPLTITNTNTSARLKVLFLRSLTLDVNVSQFFRCGSNNIQFGDTSLDATGSRANITVNIANYDGLIANGDSGVNGYSDIYVYNILVDGTGGSLQIGAGWVAKGFFANGASGCFIINCSSNGSISGNGGGIVGQSAGGSIGGGLTLRGCSSTGTIGISAGGIAGNGAGGSLGSITCEACWSEGSIASDGGGIFGAYAGVNQATAIATNCYSTGLIQNDGGGIFGGYAGDSVGQAIATNCYSRGAIQGNGGGIFSRYAAEGFGTTTATNCYSSGSLATAGYGIYGVNQRAGATSINCYVANNSWSDSTANSNLTGDPTSSDVGTTWVKRGTNQPYELNGMGYTPYTTTIITSSSQLVQSYSQTVAPGESSVESVQADASGNAFSILGITGGVAASYGTIRISVQTGSLSTSSATAVGIYTITLRSVGSYHITTFILTVSSQATSDSSACCASTVDERGLSYEWITDYKIGNRLILEVSQNPKTKFDGYSEYVKYKMAQGARKY
jgi:hypothetical protein